MHEFHTIAVKDDVLKKRFIELLHERRKELEDEFKLL